MKSLPVKAIKFFILMTLLTGILYPLLMTGMAQIFFHSKANGSLVFKEGKAIGSELIGQKFDSSIYFWSRPSAIGYNPIPSGASNYGPTSLALRKLINERRNLFAVNNLLSDSKIVPIEMISASASGLDPHISPESAFMQVERISKARNFADYKKEKLIDDIKEMTERPQFGFLGNERINVLILNMELDKLGKNLNNIK